MRADLPIKLQGDPFLLPSSMLLPLVSHAGARAGKEEVSEGPWDV
jgi:hypothetical protein